ncbi:hypothetical protein [Roseateles sp. YR242]|uniref:hypothetical protein n=1 Tax=Roseateles sp. YR242 TaxID=1855305 RepID=UPI00116065FD|nr:hypothetical protein [Roseateles sp. YR242]
MSGAVNNLVNPVAHEAHEAHEAYENLEASDARTADRLSPWWHACRQIDIGLADLRQAVHSQCADQPDQEEILAALEETIREVVAGLLEFSQSLMTTTPDLLDTAPQPPLDDELVELMDHNGFTELRLADTLQTALNRLCRP